MAQVQNHDLHFSLFMMSVPNDIVPAPIPPKPNISDADMPNPLWYPTTRPADVADPWTTPVLETPPEEHAMREEGFFPDIMEALDPDDLKKELEYFEMLPLQTSPEFLAACPDFIEYMKTEEIKRVFIVYKGSWKRYKRI